MKINYRNIVTCLLLGFLISQVFVVVRISNRINVNQSELDKLAYTSFDDSIFSQDDFELQPSLSNHFPTKIPFEQVYDDYNFLNEDDSEFSAPAEQDLRTYRINTVTSDGLPEIRRSLYEPETNDIFYRGDSILVEGNLKGFAVGEYWNGEAVKLFYNLTESQYLLNPTYYNTHPRYYVGTYSPTSDQGNFTFTVNTSDLTADPFSNIGDITLFTWFDGNPALSRKNGTAGSVVVKIYGRLKLDVVDSVTNPGATYSFTTSVLFDNDTIVNTQGTEYDLTVEWSTDGYHVNGANYTFGVTNQHTYSNTAPGPGVQTVTYTAYYDMSPLAYNFFTIEAPSNPDTDKLLYKTLSTPTEEQVVVDAYFVVGSSHIKTPYEIALDSSFTIYANLSSEAGLQNLTTIQITYTIGTVNTIEYRSTNNSGELEYTKSLPYTNVTNIALLFSIQFTALASDFPGSTITPDTLNADLAVNITSIVIAIDDTSRFYTTGQGVDYTVTIRDEFNRIAPAADFDLEFPGYGPLTRTVDGSGVWDGADTLGVVAQTPTKIINVTAANKTGATYRYVVSGSVADSDSFNVYFVLTLELTDPNSANVLDGSTWTEFNSTFWNLFTTGNYYNLSAVDQWGRKPIGASVSISLAGRVNSTIVTGSQNYVFFDLADLALTSTPNLLSTHAYAGLTLYATGGAYAPAPSISQTINIYGPDNTAPVISGIGLNPNPDDPGIHDPYYNITFTIIATDAGTGVRSVFIHYQMYEPDAVTLGPSGSVTCFNIGGDNYQGTINVTLAQSQYFVEYWVEVIDYAGHGLDEFGAKQTIPGLYYDAAFGWQTFSTSDIYQVGDFAPPMQEQAPTVIISPNPLDPYLNITIFTNDSLVYSGMYEVGLIVNVTNTVTQVMEIVNGVILLTNNPGTNQWFGQLFMDYNYNYSWYYGAADDAVPLRNIYYSYVDYGFMTASAIDDTGPIITGLDVSYNGSIAGPESVLNFTATITDLLVDVDNVTLTIQYNAETHVFDMVRKGTTDNYEYILDLSDYPLDAYGNFSLIYTLDAYDTVGNSQSQALSLTVYNAAPVSPPGGITGNIGGIVGGIAGGIIGLIAVLFLWFNRHTLQTYAKKQTFRRRLRDYLREIIEDIKKDGLEGRYKEGLLKTWAVVEGIGREFFELPRYRSQTPKEFSRLLAIKGKIERELLYTLLEYFEKARYGYEEITEADFNSGVRALLKIVDKIEVGEMKIES